MYKCKIHPAKDIEFFSRRTNEFMCSFCQFEKELTKKDAHICTDEDIVKHAKVLIQNLIAMREKFDINIMQLTEIFMREVDLDSE